MPDPSSRTSSRAGSRTGSPARRAYPNFTDQDQATLTERKSNNVDPLVNVFGQIYLTVKYI